MGNFITLLSSPKLTSTDLPLQDPPPPVPAPSQVSYLPELVSLIADSLIDDRQHGTLISMTQTCKAWQDMLRRRVDEAKSEFEEARLTSGEKGWVDEGLMSEEEWRLELRGYSMAQRSLVRHLVSCHPDSSTWAPYLEHLPSLRSLEITSSPSLSHHPLDLRPYPRITLPHLTTLTTPTTSNPSPTFEATHSHLLSHLPSLHTLTVSVSEPHTESLNHLSNWQTIIPRIQSASSTVPCLRIIASPPSSEGACGDDGADRLLVDPQDGLGDDDTVPWEIEVVGRCEGGGGREVGVRLAFETSEFAFVGKGQGPFEFGYGFCPTGLTLLNVAFKWLQPHASSLTSLRLIVRFTSSTYTSYPDVCPNFLPTSLSSAARLATEWRTGQWTMIPPDPVEGEGQAEIDDGWNQMREPPKKRYQVLREVEVVGKVRHEGERGKTEDVVWAWKGEWNESKQRVKTERSIERWKSECVDMRWPESSDTAE